MTPQQLSQKPRRTAREVILGVRFGSAPSESRVELAVEVAMNEEWWRGYYAGHGEAFSRSPLPLGYQTPDEQLEAQHGPEERPDWSQIVKS